MRDRGTGLYALVEASNGDLIATGDVTELRKTTPNPVRAASTLRIAVPRGTAMRLALYDVTGRAVRTITSGPGRGRVQEQLDLSGLATGIYFLRLEAAGQAITRKLTVVR